MRFCWFIKDRGHRATSLDESGKGKRAHSISAPATKECFAAYNLLQHTHPERSWRSSTTAPTTTGRRREGEGKKKKASSAEVAGRELEIGSKTQCGLRGVAMKT